MTDNEIIKCLRHCRAGDCENCKALNVCDATFSFHKEALDLINRQKEEIINRTEEYNDMLEQRNKCNAEIERLKDKIFVLENDLEKAENLSDALGNDVDIKLNYIYDLEEKLKKAKSEVIKEFAERLKEKLQWDVEFDNKLVFESDIDNLVKEMTEAKEK